MRRFAPKRSRSTGFSLIEVMIGLSLVTVLLVNTTVLLNSTSRASDTSREQLELDHLAAQVLDRMALALMEADREASLPQNVAPQHSSVINYQSSTGLAHGEIVYSDPSQIAFQLVDSEILWTRNAGSPSAQSVVWGRFVRDFMLQETGGNLADDNGNGLVDEFGLSFNIDAGSVLIRITLERELEDSTTITSEAWTRATFRN
jgi:prepilin-type N-terminal cleavage/methylation domain-containing protein